MEVLATTVMAVTQWEYRLAAVRVELTQPSVGLRHHESLPLVESDGSIGDGSVAWVLVQAAGAGSVLIPLRPNAQGPHYQLAQASLSDESKHVQQQVSPFSITAYWSFKGQSHTRIPVSIRSSQHLHHARGRYNDPSHPETTH